MVTVLAPLASSAPLRPNTTCVEVIESTVNCCVSGGMASCRYATTGSALMSNSAARVCPVVELLIGVVGVVATDEPPPEGTAEVAPLPREIGVVVVAVGVAPKLTELPLVVDPPTICTKASRGCPNVVRFTSVPAGAVGAVAVVTPYSCEVGRPPPPGSGR